MQKYIRREVTEDRGETVVSNDTKGYFPLTITSLSEYGKTIGDLSLMRQQWYSRPSAIYRQCINKELMVFDVEICSFR